MRISNITPQISTQNYKRKTTATNTHVSNSQTNIERFGYVPSVSFKAMHNIKQKSIDTELETKKLLKQFDDILASDMSLEELIHLYERKVTEQLLQKKQRAEALLEEATRIMEDPYINQMKAERLLAIQKEFKQLEKNVFKINPMQIPKKPDTNIDTALINKFKTAILEDNFNLDKVYTNYYSGLNEIKTIEELNKKYPQIKIPDRPEYVIADKIVASLTRDFFEHLDRMMFKSNEEAVYNFIDTKVKDILANSTKNPEKIYEKVFESTVIDILMKYDKLRQTNTFSSVPQFRKNNSVQISENDLKLLDIDFDNFVLFVLKKQYLENQKPNTIKYTDGNISIPVSSLKENYYKFEKTSEKIKLIISDAKKIQTAKRDYEHFDDSKLRDMLNFYAGTEIGNDDKIFDRIVAFDSCNFGQTDKAALIQFLKILDSIKDGELSLLDGWKMIESGDIRPKETEKLNELEREKVIESLKYQQKLAFELNSLKSRFDDAMNLLYLNGLSSSAAICTKYRPENLEQKSVENSEFLIELINKNIENNKNEVKNKLKNWDTYNYYKLNDPKSEILQKAEKYALNKDGSIDNDRAGRYLKNAETVMNKSQSLDYLPDGDIISEIIERSSNEDAAIEYLCKYDEYKELSDSDKTHLLKYVDKFNLKDNVDKFILKNIIENDYVNTDTKSVVKQNETTNKVEATISANAKKQIMEKYMFPGCVEFMTGFEDALSSIATEYGSSGIKKTGTNNKALEYKFELKLIGHDDRLFAVDNKYYFDIFSDRGLH